MELNWVLCDDIEGGMGGWEAGLKGRGYMDIYMSDSLPRTPETNIAL